MLDNSVSRILSISVIVTVLLEHIILFTLVIKQQTFSF